MRNIKAAVTVCDTDVHKSAPYAPNLQVLVRSSLKISALLIRLLKKKMASLHFIFLHGTTSKY